MKYINYLISLILYTVLFCAACKKTDGEATSPNFNNNPVILSAKAQEIILKAKNNVNWSLSDLSINKGKEIRDEDWDTYPNLKYYSSTKEQMLNKYRHLQDIYRVEYEWFTWEKIDNRTIKLTVKENNSGEKRTLDFTAFAGNAQDKINLTQNPK